MRPMTVLACCLGAAALLLGGCSGGAAATMVVDGRVDLGPLCPVERADSPCAVPPGTFDGVEAVATSDDAQVRAPVGADGGFTLALTEGSWEVTATAGMSCAPVTVVAAGPITVTCDTGIR